MRYATLGFLLLFMSALDRASKMLTLACWEKNPLHVTSRLSLGLEQNHGFAWGVGAYMPKYILMLIMAIAIMGLIYRITLNWCKNLVPTGEALVLAGGLSNLFDRVFYGSVIDFIQIFVEDYRLSVFNIADVYIVMGLIFMLKKAWNDGLS